MGAEATLTALASIVIAAIGIIPATLAAIWARTGKKQSAAALHEVQANGGMSDPDPTLKDRMMDIADKMDVELKRNASMRSLLHAHLAESAQRAVVVDELAQWMKEQKTSHN